ncbi:SusD/RagB family nutrient-binding outer membrane lipoprotein, partial [Salmonella enterica subsp. enterica serovar Typhimurium]|nr:SusD/RagB family nutrient-binding outer membrane lipoprotein [Salmonella enterica subsp. enterica serovar Typhimurium]
MFGGDQTKWVKFANTLKLRLLMHQASRADRAAYVQAEIAKIVAEGSGFLGSGEDAAVNPGFQQDKPNAFYA